MSSALLYPQTGNTALTILDKGILRRQVDKVHAHEDVCYVRHTLLEVQPSRNIPISSGRLSSTPRLTLCNIPCTFASCASKSHITTFYMFGNTSDYVTSLTTFADRWAFIQPFIQKLPGYDGQQPVDITTTDWTNDAEAGMGATRSSPQGSRMRLRISKPSKKVICREACSSLENIQPLC